MQGPSSFPCKTSQRTKSLRPALLVPGLPPHPRQTWANCSGKAMAELSSTTTALNWRSSAMGAASARPLLLRHLVQEPFQKAGSLRREALTQPWPRNRHCSSVQDLCQAIHRHLRFLQPAKDQRLGKSGSGDLPHALDELRLFGQHFDALVQDRLERLGYLCYITHGGLLLSSPFRIFFV